MTDLDGSLRCSGTVTEKAGVSGGHSETLDYDGDPNTMDYLMEIGHAIIIFKTLKQINEGIRNVSKSPKIVDIVFNTE